MKRKRSLYYALLVLLNLVLIYAISTIYTFYSGPNELNEIKQENIQLNEALNPYIHWEFSADDVQNNLLTKNLDDLTRDLIRAEYYLNKSRQSYKDVNLPMYFTDTNVNYIHNILRDNLSQHSYTNNTILNYSPYLDFFSLDRKLAVFTDSHQVSMHNLNVKDKIVQQSIDSSIIRYVSLLEEGHWRIHKRKVLNRSSISFSDYIKRTPPKIVTQNQIAHLRGVNYYPQNSAWFLFFKDFDIQIIKADFAKIKTLNLNCVRVFIPYFSMQKKSQAYDIINKTTQLLALADKFNLQVILCLFDFYNGATYEHWPNQMPYLDTVAWKLKDHPALYAWDIKNEPDLDIQYYGEKQVKDWLAFFIHRLREIDQKHPITIGWAHSENANTLSDYVDFISFHDYTEPYTLEKKIAEIQSINGDKAIMLGEVGRSTYHGIWKLYGFRYQDQDRYYRQLNDFSVKKKIPYLFWTLYDFDSIPEGIVKPYPWRLNPQKNFGIIDTNDLPKPAYFSIKNNTRIDYRNRNYRSYKLVLAFILIFIGISLIGKNVHKKFFS